MTPMTVSARLLAHGYKFPTSTFADQLDAGAYAVVGSRLYGLADKTSDTDYVLYTVPTFEQVYTHSYPSLIQTSDSFDHSVSALPKLEERLSKGNPEAFNILYSPSYLMLKKTHNPTIDFGLLHKAFANHLDVCFPTAFHVVNEGN